MIFNVYFPAPMGSVYTKDSFERVRGSTVSLAMGDQEIPAQVLDVSVNDDGSGATFTFDVDAEFHYHVGPRLEDLLTVRFKSSEFDESHAFEPYNADWHKPRCKVCQQFEDHSLHKV